MVTVKKLVLHLFSRKQNLDLWQGGLDLLQGGLDLQQGGLDL